MSWLKKKLWFQVMPPLRVFKCTKGILLVTGNFDVTEKGLIHRLWLYDGKHFRPADSTIYSSRRLREINGFEANNELIAELRQKVQSL